MAVQAVSSCTDPGPMEKLYKNTACVFGNVKEAVFVLLGVAALLE